VHLIDRSIHRLQVSKSFHKLHALTIRFVSRNCIANEIVRLCTICGGLLRKYIYIYIHIYIYLLPLYIYNRISVFIIKTLRNPDCFARFRSNPRALLRFPKLEKDH